MAEQASSAKREDLLIEIGCEELPPKALDAIRDAWFDAIRSGLEKSGLAFEEGGSRAYSTPRRLAVCFRGVAARQPHRVQHRRGPSLEAAYDAQGAPTRAAIGFARSVGKAVEELDTERNEKGEWLSAEVRQVGQPLSELIYPLLQQSLRQLPIPRPMRWSDHDFSFARPVHWLLLLYGEQILEGSLLGQTAGNLTRGHRIHSPGPHTVAHPEHYEAVLERAFVVPDPNERRRRIVNALQDRDANARIRSGLLAEVNNLVEWPVIIECSFEEEFLSVPHAALIASMEDHQKFFPVMEAEHSDRVTNRFLVVCNLESQDVEVVRAGYERVIRPRLADARFFLEQDLKAGLEHQLPRLDGIVFQKTIGTIGDKSRRMAALSRNIADDIAEDPDVAERAALLSKCDLMTQMVAEFPELQGIMGRHYALAEGEDPIVAEAIEEHYRPRYAGDAIPASTTGRIVGVADRVDTLVGVFAAGLRPSGNKDPFALRRSALGLIRILLEAELELELNRLLALAANALSDRLDISPSLLLELREFCQERLRSLYRERGFGAELISASLASQWDTLPDLDRRLRALNSFMNEEAAGALATANKRIGNILRKAEQPISKEIDADRLILREEKVIFEEVKRLSKEIGPWLAQGEYAAALGRLAELREPVDAFFDSVMVMDDDPKLRANRLALLARLKSLFDRIADLSVLG